VVRAEPARHTSGTNHSARCRTYVGDPAIGQRRASSRRSRPPGREVVGPSPNIAGPHDERRGWTWCTIRSPPASRGRRR
jgi:hypothetical protein